MSGNETVRIRKTGHSGISTLYKSESKVRTIFDMNVREAALNACEDPRDANRLSDALATEAGYLFLNDCYSRASFGWLIENGYDAVGPISRALVGQDSNFGTRILGFLFGWLRIPHEHLSHDEVSAIIRKVAAVSPVMSQCKSNEIIEIPL